jgi:2-polyprenyl-3-methyl-5-hydroxy-6-metoxy-1,4-benzoquinol methylase
MEKVYFGELARLQALADSLPNTPLMAQAKLSALVLLNMRYEKVRVDRDLAEHPYRLVAGLVRAAREQLACWAEVAFIEDSAAPVLRRDGASMEEEHRALFQRLWVLFPEEDYRRRIDRYVHRLRLNGLGDGELAGARCVDFGCGHGNFAHALLRVGARRVVGVDYGEANVAYAREMRRRLGVDEERLELRVESVYAVAEEDGSCDFAVQNGVFHHLADEDAAYREVWRVLKPGGRLWIYSEGSGGIAHDLWDASVRVLRDVPQEFICAWLSAMKIEAGRQYDLGDGMVAVYRHSTWDELTGRLAALGFADFRRLLGGFPEDSDPEAIAADPYGPAKYGEGDLRILARKPANG